MREGRIPEDQRSQAEFLVSLAMGASICGAKRVGRASPF